MKSFNPIAPLKGFDAYFVAGLPDGWSRALRRRFVNLLTVAMLSLLIQSATAASKVPTIQHQPAQPKSGDTVRITADTSKNPAPEQLTLQHQVVDPGNYIAFNDPQFKQQWISLPMNDAGERGDQVRSDGVFTVELPAPLQQHRRLVRYRIVSAKDNKQIAPEPGDGQPNFAYFVYDGVPPWKGAINPRSRDPKLRETVTYSSDALQGVPTYHFVSKKSSVENATWYEPAQWGVMQGRNEYKYTGTMVYEGNVYDHVGFRARGGQWRHSMGKNMWKFNFLPGHRFQARDNYGRPYETKWDKLNLGACIQQGGTGMRGEQGMFEAVGFRLFNLAGVEAPLTHWVHLRIIDGLEENPADQYSGDFWGLYLATENIDGRFLKEHHLPEGNLYKMDFMRPKTAFNGNPKITDQSDVNQFIRLGMTRPPQPDSWWIENVDLGRYYGYRSILECIHHYDLDMGKNYFYYFNPSSNKWSVLPWDVDLSWGDRMFGGGYEPLYRAGFLSRSPCKEQYQERLAEIRDLLFNAEQVNLLIDEHARMISDPQGAHAIVDADRAKWDYHPILASSHVLANKAGQGKFYFGNANNRFSMIVDYMKGYAATRAAWIDSQLLRDYRAPQSPRIVPSGSLDLSAASLKFRIESAPAVQTANIRWRLAEITQTNSPAFNPRQPWKFEINALWEGESKGETLELPTAALMADHSYRVRARWRDAAGRWSRWSSPVQFTAEKKN
jgi:hypothetical protein